MKRPVIGITCGEIRNKEQQWAPITHGQSQTYVKSILDAGGVPVLIPLIDDTVALKQLFATLDGLYLAGGNDLHPNLYNQQPTSETTDYSVLRDTVEKQLLEWALEAKMPILGICRGMQLLNVHFGGTLYQDIPTELPGSLDHDTSTKQKSLVDLSHTLSIVPETKLHHILDTATIGANAHHHQAIKDLGERVIVSARAEDGIIEGIELADYPFAIGIQAHPESLTKVEPNWQNLFTSFVTAIKNSRTSDIESTRA